jgi:TetR/AcrR family fatty acid metabolism transcriptional regulator
MERMGMGRVTEARGLRQVSTESSTRELILKAAEELFSTKGFENATISDISSAVGISESTVYEHFKNKEDILFSVPPARTRELIQINEDHLRGLMGAWVKLRKLVWNYFEFLINHESYMNLLLFELRGNRDFYKTAVYGEFKVFARSFKEVIVEGTETGEFRAHLDPRVLLNLIFGAMDLIIITRIIKKATDNPYTDLEAFLDFLQHAIVSKDSPPPVNDKRRRILDAAAEAFSEFGYGKTRIQQIARLAGVGDGTIYQYFKNKQEILFTLPIEHTKNLITIHGKHFREIKDSELRLIVLINDYLTFCELNRAYISIVLLELRYNRNFYQTKAYNLFREFARIFYDIIKEGIAQGHFRESVDPYIAVKCIHGAIDHTILSWLMFNNPERLVSLSDPIGNLILVGLKA